MIFQYIYIAIADNNKQDSQEYRLYSKYVNIMISISNPKIHESDMIWF